MERQGVVAVVVSFDPDLDNWGLMLRELCVQVLQVVVVDNGSDTNIEKWLIATGIPNVECIALGYNRGIATALNVGIGRARELNAGFVLLMDQDSIPRGGMVDALMRGYGKMVARGNKVAVIGPRCVDKVSGTLSSHKRFARFRVGRIACIRRDEPVSVDFLITSGSLIPMAVLDEVGRMEDGLFVDHVDTEWVLRARGLGYDVFGDCEALMEHSIGELRRRIWVLHWREVPEHKPVRYYYMVRNSILLYRRPSVSRTWKQIDAVRLAQVAVFILILGPQRRRKLLMMWRGVWDGIRGKIGPIGGES